MSEIVKVEMLSRRQAFSLLGLTAALGFAVPITLLAGSAAEAQAPLPLPHRPLPRRRPVGRWACSGVMRGELLAMSGARSGEMSAMSGARSGAEVAKPHNPNNRDVPEGVRSGVEPKVDARRVNLAPTLNRRPPHVQIALRNGGAPGKRGPVRRVAPKKTPQAGWRAGQR